MCTLREILHSYYTPALYASCLYHNRRSPVTLSLSKGDITALVRAFTNQLKAATNQQVMVNIIINKQQPGIILPAPGQFMGDDRLSALKYREDGAFNPQLRMSLKRGLAVISDNRYITRT